MANRTSMDNMAVQLEDIAKDITGTPIAKGGYAWDIIDNAVTTIAEAVGAEVPEKKFSTKKDRVAAVVTAIADADVSGGGGGSAETEAAIIMGTLSGAYENSAVTFVPESAFAYNEGLTAINFPNCKSIGSNAFGYCTNLSKVELSTCSTIGSQAFYGCSALEDAVIPNKVTVGATAFAGCYNLKSISLSLGRTGIDVATFSNCTALSTVTLTDCAGFGIFAFQGCSHLLSLYLIGSNTVTAVSSVFDGTPIGGNTTYTGGEYGSIYVPASLLSWYQTYGAWSSLSSRFVAYDPE